MPQWYSLWACRDKMKDIQEGKVVPANYGFPAEKRCAGVTRALTPRGTLYVVQRVAASSREGRNPAILPKCHVEDHSPFRKNHDDFCAQSGIVVNSFPESITARVPFVAAGTFLQLAPALHRLLYGAAFCSEMNREQYTGVDKRTAGDVGSRNQPPMVVAGPIPPTNGAHNWEECRLLPEYDEMYITIGAAAGRCEQ